MKETISRQIVFYTRVSWILIIAGVLFIVFVTIYYFFDSKIAELNLIGDFLGGSVASLWALAGVFFIYVAFLGQKLQLIQQQDDINLSRKELKLTRKELKYQRKQMEEQTAIYRKQIFENTFFNQLKIHHEIVNNVDFGSGDSRRSGTDCFKKFYERFASYYKQSREESDMTKLSEAMRNLMNDHGQDLNHYFNNLIQIIDLPIRLLKTKEDVFFYIKIVKAQLSSYECLLFYYKAYVNDELKKLLKDHDFFEYIIKEILLSDDHANLYENNSLKTG